MNARRFIVAAAIVVAAPAAIAAKLVHDTGPVARLHRLFDDEWQRYLRESPEDATRLGDRRYNDRWTDLSAIAIEQRHHEDEAALKKLAAIPRAQLPPEEQLNYDLFKQNAEDGLAAWPFREFTMPLDHIYGIQTLYPNILELLSFDTRKDYENWIARLRAFGAYADQTLALMRAGVAEGRVRPRVLMEKVPEQLASQIVDKPEDSPAYAPFRQFPASIPEADRAALRAAAAQAIASVVVPAFTRVQEYFKAEYLPKSRDSVGASALPNGAAYYAHLVRHHTTTDLSPENIHEIGLAEVARIHREMDAVMKQAGFKGSFEDFVKFLRTDRRFFYTKGEDLLEGYAALAKRIDGELPRLFGRLPRLPYGVRAIPDAIAPHNTTAYYQNGAADGTRAGFFYCNLYKPETRPKWEMEALTVHEAVPGHHLQISLAQELEGLPDFRKNGLSFTAFVEGWGLYSESLGSELGLYKDPYSKFGQLTYEMWRAVRLVVDTGLHAKGWTRQQAIDYFAANAAKTPHDIEVEVDRYIAWPGQALAYKLGELKIKELRARATETLGAKFDIRKFHDVVLGSGPLPLDILERNVDNWIAAQAAAR